MHDQKQYNGIVVGLDKDTDLAVIKIEAEGLIPAEFGDDNALSVGETVVADWIGWCTVFRLYGNGRSCSQ